MVAKFKKSKKRVTQSIFLLILLGILAVGVIGFLAISSFKISQKRTKLTNQIESLRNQIQELEQRKIKLEAQISYQKSEEYLEEVARDTLNLKSPGEQGIAFIKEEMEETEVEEKKSFFEKVLDFFEKVLEKIRFW